MSQPGTTDPWRPHHPAELFRPVNDAATPIPTEAEWALWRRMVPKIRRCITIGAKKPGRQWHTAATVEEIASACKLSCEDVVRMIGMCGWLIAVNNDADEIGKRTVYEDGE